MNVTLRPEIEKLVKERLKSGSFQSLDDLINSALEQFMLDDFEPGELDALLKVGEEQARNGNVVDGDQVFERLREKSKSRRNGA